MEVHRNTKWIIWAAILKNRVDCDQSGHSSKASRHPAIRPSRHPAPRDPESYLLKLSPGLVSSAAVFWHCVASQKKDCGGDYSKANYIVVRVEFREMSLEPGVPGPASILGNSGCFLRLEHCPRCILGTVDCGLRTEDCGLQTADCRLRTADLFIELC